MKLARVSINRVCSSVGSVAKRVAGKMHPNPGQKGAGRKTVRSEGSPAADADKGDTKIVWHGAELRAVGRSSVGGAMQAHREGKVRV